MPLLELDTNKKITASYLYGADGVVYRRKHIAVAHWHFDEGNGTVAHDVDGQNNGTLGDGNASMTPAWSVDGGLGFDGVNDKVKVPDSDALDLASNALTISLWLKRQAATAGVLVKKADTSNGYQLSVTASGTLQFEIRQAGTTKTVTSTTTIPLNQWKHIAVRYDGSALRVFINATLDTATTAATRSLVATTAPLWMGGDTTYLNGALDDLSIYNRALSDTEISNVSNNRPGRYEYHHTNALGSNIVLTDDSKNVLARYEYDVFGAIRNETGTSDNTRKFTGKEWDADASLYYFAARYYDPYIGRFTQRDPAEDGVNWFAYANNNPMKFIDPTGLRPVKEIEQDALRHTFGAEVGGFLGSRIDIQFDGTVETGTVRPGTLNVIHLSPNYDENKLHWLGTFIHEATHIWQRHTNRHRDGVGEEVKDYDYTRSQIESLDLKNEEHAGAVQDWFRATYGVESGKLGDDAGAWNATLGTMGFSSREINEFTDSQKVEYINLFYNPLVQEIRQTGYIWTTNRFR